VIIFITSIIMGGILIHNLGKEVITKKEVARLIKKLENNNDRLKELDKQKSEFVSLASHQLRGPVSVIQGYVSMLIEGDYGQISAEAKIALQKVFQTGTGLNFLINDYLDVSKLDKGEMEYVLEDIKISEFLEEILKTFEPIFVQNKIELIKNISKTNIKVRGDKNKTRQIISNIIDNSLKYTPTGSIKVELNNDLEFVVISIADTGIGIPIDKLDNIFEKFNRTEEAISLSVTGTGLGLYVAKIMTEAQGGKIWAESKGPGSGSTFHIKLPVTN
jgi:signal transduction histidine kinase